MISDDSLAARGDTFVTVSSNTLFHFTNSFENLLGILRNEFEPRYCLEESLNSAGTAAEFALPMVCFCDLPLSQTATHLAFYGNYGVGLSKEWGHRQRISPVLYASRGSQVLEQLRSIFQKLRGSANDVPDAFGPHFTQLIAYIKPYEGRFWRRGGYIDNVRFYNEREWRFVPLEAGEKNWIMTKPQFLDEENRNRCNRELAKEVHLGFNPDDIRYIIVARDSEILPMVDHVLQIKGSKYSYDSLRLLTTRIISAEQIREDF